MAYDGIFFTSLTKEFIGHLVGKKVEKINQHSERILSMSFSRLKEWRLEINIGSESPYIALSENRLPNPEQAPMFCMLLRKQLGGGIVKAVDQVQGDRILRFEFSALNEMRDEETKILIVEIMGRHSNLILCDAKMRVIDSLKHINPLMSKRPMGPGYDYAPPFAEKLRLEKITPALIEECLQEEEKVEALLYKKIAGLSPCLAKRLVLLSEIDGKKSAMELSEEESGRLYKEMILLGEELRSQQKPYLYRNPKGSLEISNLSLPQLKENGYSEQAFEQSPVPYSALTLLYFDRKGKNEVLLQKINSLSALLRQILEKELKRIENLNKDKKSAESLEKYKLYGELCMANIHLIKKGMKSIRVLNYYNNEEIDLPLKFDKSASENAESFFKRYQKMKKTLVYAEEQIGIAEAKIEHLESVLSALEQCEDVEDFDAIRAELIAEQLVKEKQAEGRKKKAEKRLPPREFISPNGIPVKVGRNNLQNDELTLKSASKKHIWLHTKIIPSSHVILCAKLEDAKEEDILFAASICARYSKARFSENVPVDFTEVKNVSKPRGAKPGKVIYVDYRTVYVDPHLEE